VHSARNQSSTLAPAIEGLLVVGGYGTVAVLAMAPLFSDLGGATLDPHRPWLSSWYAAGNHELNAGAMLRDIRLFVWTYAWNWHALLTQPTAWFDANIFHPAPDALAYSEHAIGKLPITGLLQALTGNPVFAYQGDLLLCFALSGAAMYALLRYANLSRPAALVAGFVYAFSPMRREVLFHTYMLAGQYLPLTLLFLDRTLASARWRDATACAAFLLLHCASSYYLAYQAPIALGAYLLAACTLRPRPTAAALGRAAAALGVAGVGLAVLSLPYLRLRGGDGLPSFAAAAAALGPLSNDLWRSYLLPTWWLRWHEGIGLTRGAHAYVGLIAGGLAIVGFARRARLGTPAARLGTAALGIVVASWVMALGPLLAVGGHTLSLPYQLAMAWVPGFDSMRVPYRFALLLMTGVSVLAGLGTDVLMRSRLAARTPRRLALTAGLVIALAGDYGLGSERYTTLPLAVGRRGPEVYRVLAGLEPGPLLEIPFTQPNGLWASEYMVHSTTHWLPMLHGSSGYAPRSQRVLRPLTRQLPAAAALHRLVRMTGLRYVLVHDDRLPAPAAAAWRDPAGLRPLGTFGAARLFAVIDPPPADLLPAVRACAADAAACATLERQAEG
jgi:hypothetical protein